MPTVVRPAKAEFVKRHRHGGGSDADQLATRGRNFPDFLGAKDKKFHTVLNLLRSGKVLRKTYDSGLQAHLPGSNFWSMANSQQAACRG
jgi:hypothetical protein